MKFAMIGAGFWAHYQLAAWNEVGEATCVAVCDTDEAKARKLADARGVATTYTDAETMLQKEKLDFVDIVASVEAHRPLVELAARHGVGVICQKPMAQTLAECEAMVATCRDAGVAFFIHENWRYQTPIQALKALLETRPIGAIFRARLDMVSGFPVFKNQPALATLERFLLADMGVHTLDAVRFLFGEAQRLYCQTQRVHPDIAGEDVATVLLTMRSGAIVSINMGYAENPMGEDECFPETLIFIEGAGGTIRLDKDYWLRVTTADGVRSWRVPPPQFDWVDPDYAVAQSSTVACCRDILSGLRGEVDRGQTHGADNLETLRLVFGAYDSAERGETIRL